MAEQHKQRWLSLCTGSKYIFWPKMRSLSVDSRDIRLVSPKSTRMEPMDHAWILGTVSLVPKIHAVEFVDWQVSHGSTLWNLRTAYCPKNSRESQFLTYFAKRKKKNKP